VWRSLHGAAGPLAIACAFDSGGLGTGDENPTPMPGTGTTAPDPTTSTASSTTEEPTTTSSPDAGTTTDTSGESTSTASPGDSSGDGTTGRDPPPLGPFAAPVEIDTLSSLYNEDDPSVRFDFLEIYFASDRAGGSGLEDIWRATRADANAPWDLPVPVTELNSTWNDGGPELLDDGLAMYFHSDRPGGAGGFDIYVSQRSTLVAQWQAPVRITELSTATLEATPALSSDQLEMFYCGTSITATLMRTTRPAMAMAWLAPAMVAELDDPLADDCSPFLLADDMRLAFSSTRLGGAGAADLWYSEREAGVFAPPQLIEGVNAIAFDDDPWISPDGELIVFASNRGAGDFDLWMAEAER
jgi:hypothetical protein